jgi:hypothetical protein
LEEWVDGFAFVISGGEVQGGGFAQVFAEAPFAQSASTHRSRQPEQVIKMQVSSWPIRESNFQITA